ncbi:hypothetical protein LXL04_023362 [Taraxacum kok-saghyz]
MGCWFSNCDLKLVNFVLQEKMAFEVGQQVEVNGGDGLLCFAFYSGRILALYQMGALVEFDDSFDENSFPHLEIVLYGWMRPLPEGFSCPKVDIQEDTYIFET